MQLQRRRRAYAAAVNPIVKRRVFALLVPALLLTAAAPARAVIEPVTACIDRYLAKLKPGTADIATIGTYGEACAELIRQQNVSDYSSASNAVLVNQRYNTNVLLWMVVVITLAGTILAGVQLYWSYRLALLGKGELPGGSEVTVANNSLAVKSSVVGVLILGLSLVFFIVFVWKVYPITLLAEPTGEATQTGLISDSASPAAEPASITPATAATTATH